MFLFNKLKNKNKFEKVLTLSILVAIFLLFSSCIRYIILGSVNWDEPFQLHSLEKHLSFAQSILDGEKKDYQDLPSNMEWYGVGLKLIYSAPRLAFQKLFGSNKLALYASLRGFGLLVYIFAGVILYYTSNFYQKSKSKILPLIYFTFPLLAGESYLNITDIPFAICFTFYSLINGILVIKNNTVKEKKSTQSKVFLTKKSFFENKKILNILSTFSAALLINSKASMIAPVLIIETILAFYISDKGVDIYKNFINLTKKFIVRLFAILGFTYLITPSGWIEPFRYYTEVVKAFARFGGFSSAYINGAELTTNTESWSLFEYLWRWGQIKIPLIMIILVFIFISLFIYKLITRKGRYKDEAIFNPILIFYGLQLALTPAIAIAANSSSYNALRHWCFLYPPLIVFSAFVVDNYLINSKSKKFNLFSKFVVVVLTVLANIDNVLMMPYSNISFNTYGRKFVNHKNTDIDYWGYSAGELLKKKVSKGYQIRSPEAPFKMNTSHTPYHVKNQIHKYPYVFGTHTIKNMKDIDDNCKKVENVSRKLLFRKDPIIMSKIGICPIHSSNVWNVYSSNEGKIEVELKENKTFIVLPSKLTAFSLRRIKEEEISNTKNLVMLFLNKGKLSVEKVTYENNKLKHTSFKIQKKEDIGNYFKNYLKPKTLLTRGFQDNIIDWELGLYDEKSNVEKIYENDSTALVSLKKQYVGLVCKRKNDRPLKIIIKKPTGELLVRGLDSLNLIKNPDIKPGIFYINKVECIFDKEDNIEKIFVYETNLLTNFRWQIGLDGFFLNSKQI